MKLNMNGLWVDVEPLEVSGGIPTTIRYKGATLVFNDATKRWYIAFDQDPFEVVRILAEADYKKDVEGVVADIRAEVADGTLKGVSQVYTQVRDLCDEHPRFTDPLQTTLTWAFTKDADFDTPGEAMENDVLAALGNVDNLFESEREDGEAHGTQEGADA